MKCNEKQRAYLRGYMDGWIEYGEQIIESTPKRRVAISKIVAGLRGISKRARKGFKDEG